jgi:hypothetical protein
MRKYEEYKLLCAKGTRNFDIAWSRLPKKFTEWMNLWLPRGTHALILH